MTHICLFRAQYQELVLDTIVKRLPDVLVAQANIYSRFLKYKFKMPLFMFYSNLILLDPRTFDGKRGWFGLLYTKGNVP